MLVFACYAEGRRIRLYLWNNGHSNSSYKSMKNDIIILLVIIDFLSTVELAQRKEKSPSTAFMAECVKIIMICTVSISMHTNSLTSVGWSVCVHCQQKE